MNIKKIFFVIVPSFLICPLAFAHHSFAEFIEAEMITVKGVVTEWKLVNPHAWMKFDVQDEDGNVVQWEVQFDGRTHIGRAGWTDETIKAGETIEVTGNPARSGSPYMFFVTGIKGDGTELVRPYKLSFENAEEERQRRRESRNSSDSSQ